MKKIITMLTFLLVFAIGLVGTISVHAATDFSSHTVYLDAQGGEYTHPYVNELKTVLANELPASLLFIGDSTSNDTTEWVYLTGQYLVDEIDDYSINYRLFDDTTKSYKTISQLQTGDAGDAYAILDGTYGTAIETESTEELSITGDIDIAVKVAADDWSDSSIKTLVDKLGYGPNRGFNFYLNPTSAIPHLYYSADGTTLINVAATVAPTVVDGEPLWFRVTMDVDNGAAGNDVKFYTSSDGSTWAQLGTTVTTAGVTSIYENTTDLTFGSRDGGVADTWAGKFYEAIVRDGIDGQVVASPDMGNIREGSTFEDVEGNTYTIAGGVDVGYGAPELTILNASVAGKTISYFSNEVAFGDVVTLDPEMTFISLGHNEGASLDVQVAYNAFLEQIRAKYLNTNLVVVAQNPQVAPATADAIAAHAIRQQQMGAIASEKGYGYIDAFEALSADTATYISADGVHPTATGSAVWEAEAEAFLSGAFGTGVETYHIEVEDSTVANLPDDPTKVGYVFDGWYTNEALTAEYNEDGAIVTADETLYAKWIVEGSAGTGTITTPTETASFLGLAWYYWAAIAVGGYVLLSNKKVRKSIGLKK